MADDLLDYTLNTSMLGKEVGADLKEGKLTLPVIYSLKVADAKDRNQMEKIITDRDFSIDDFERLIELMKKYGGQTYTQNLAAEYVKTAKDALGLFKPSEAREILMMLADYTLARKE
jgi:octaprenyl-diphosphate synthase